MKLQADGRLGVDFPKKSRKIRESPLQLLSARKGIQVVPRKAFRPESIDSGRFYFTKERNKMRELPKIYEPQQTEASE